MKFPEGLQVFGDATYRGECPLEEAEQATFVSQFAKAFPHVRMFAIPNGGFRHKATAVKLQITGTSKGVPDLYIPAWKCWIEMKRTKGGRVSEEQKSWHEYLAGIGDTVLVTKGWEEAMKQVREVSKSYEP